MRPNESGWAAETETETETETILRQQDNKNQLNGMRGVSKRANDVVDSVVITKYEQEIKLCQLLYFTKLHSP